METNTGFGAIFRVWLLALVAVAVWAVCHVNGTPSEARKESASLTDFSAGRAENALARVLGPEKPHPISSEENAAVRARVLSEFAALGIPARTYKAFTCNYEHGFSFVGCATVTDIIADVIPGDGKAIILLAHYDSVPAGPGASDDESGVATVLETARALKARGAKSLHPVMAVITDGEEAGLLGANAFLQNEALKARVGVVVNVEARGTRGQSLLFQTSPGDGRLIDLYAHRVKHAATSSLYAEIYKFLPNDTDLTLFIHAGFPSFNFAFADNVQNYHSPLDLRRNLSPATLQMHGDNMLGVVSGLEQTDYPALKGGNDIYLSVLGAAVPRLPASWALPLAILVFFVIAFAAWLSRGEDSDWRSGLRAFAMPLAVLVGCGLIGWLLSFIAQLVSGQPDPTYAFPINMRLALGFGVWAITVLVSRMTSVHGAASAAWLWIAGLGVVTAALLPGISPYFLFPAIIAAVLLLATARAPGGWSGAWGQAALFVSALSAFVVWFALVSSGETLMGLSLHPLFTIPAAFGLMTIVPLLATHPMAQGAWRTNTAIFAVLSLACAVAAALQPAYSTVSPQRVNIIYLENGKAPARWLADTAWKATDTSQPPAALVKAGGFKLSAEAYDGLFPGKGWTAPAGAARYPLPASSVKSETGSDGMHKMTLSLRGSAGTSAMLLRIPKEMGLKAIDIRGQHIAMAGGWSGTTMLACESRDCGTEDVTLTYSNANAGNLVFAEERYGLPPFGDALKAARPVTAMPSQSGDAVVLLNSVRIGTQ